jgi:hypothetical protein
MSKDKNSPTPKSTTPGDLKKIKGFAMEIPNKPSKPKTTGSEQKPKK